MTILGGRERDNLQGIEGGKKKRIKRYIRDIVGRFPM
jgi:hypothetical protein